MVTLQEDEIFTFLMGIVVLLFIFLASESLKKRFPSFNLILGGFIVLVLGWLLTLLEHFAFTDFFNFLEHICYTLSNIFLFIWSWKVFVRREAQQWPTQ